MVRSVPYQQHNIIAIMISSTNYFPVLATFVNNCYKTPPRLFILGGEELLSLEGDPLGMAIYAIGITPLLEIMKQYMLNDEFNRSAAFADVLASAGKRLYINGGYI